jgi:predicted nucleic acid-binding protein
LRPSSAVEGRVDAVITGDNHVLALKEFHGIPILTPRAFVDRFLS